MIFCIFPNAGKVLKLCRFSFLCILRSWTLECHLEWCKLTNRWFPFGVDFIRVHDQISYRHIELSMARQSNVWQFIDKFCVTCSIQFDINVSNGVDLNQESLCDFHAKFKSLFWYWYLFNAYSRTNRSTGSVCNGIHFIQLWFDNTYPRKFTSYSCSHFQNFFKIKK